MRSGLHVGRIFGINIFVDWSWIFIFLLVTWNLTAAVFPSLHPDWSFGLNLAIGVAASLLFFASVLAHELAHSLVAKARGLPVRRITLFIFGGVSNIEREPPSPLTEFLIAIVGPATSIVLGIVFILLARVNISGTALFSANMDIQEMLAGLSPIASLLLYLGPINILLGIFNLVPGFPLDGGRVLRSILWAGLNNLRLATRLATWVGQLVAWLFIIAGISMAFGVQIPILGTGLVSGLWLAFIGWFLNNAATQSYQQVVVEDMLEGVPVARLMRANTPAVAPGMMVSELVDRYIMATDEQAFPVVQDERLVGLVCLEDVRKSPRSQWDDKRVEEIMTPLQELKTISPRDDASDALTQLAGREVSQLPVVLNGELVGMLRQKDIVRWLRLQSDSLAS